MHDNRFLVLITRKLSGEATITELAELADMLSNDLSLRKEAEVYARYWEQQQQEQHGSTEQALQKVIEGIRGTDTFREQEENTPVRRIGPWKKLIRLAAVIVLLLGLSLGAYKIFFQPEKAIANDNNLVQKQNAKGVKSTIELADGSKIWLNADSKIQYPAVFNGNSREVYLNGEAFFDIAKNPAKPFIIHLANGTVRVLGTSFNIKAYDGEPVIETSVSTGKVAFIPKLKNRQADTIFLMPNNKVVYQVSDEKILTSATISAEDKAWTEGKMVFRSMLFAEIGVELERNFGKQVVFIDEETKNYRLTGSFQNNTLSEILYYLSKGKSFSYSITDEQIVISR